MIKIQVPEYKGTNDMSRKYEIVVVDTKDMDVILKSSENFKTIIKNVYTKDPLEILGRQINGIDEIINNVRTLIIRNEDSFFVEEINLIDEVNGDLNSGDCNMAEGDTVLDTNCVLQPNDGLKRMNVHVLEFRKYYSNTSPDGLPGKDRYYRYFFISEEPFLRDKIIKICKLYKEYGARMVSKDSPFWVLPAIYYLDEYPFMLVVTAEPMTDEKSIAIQKGEEQKRPCLEGFKIRFKEIWIDKPFEVMGHWFKNLDDVKDNVDICYNTRRWVDYPHRIELTNPLKDIHILELYEMYPCFDSYDYANETRFYRNFFFSREPFTDEDVDELSKISQKPGVCLVSEETPKWALPALYYKGEGSRMLLAILEEDLP